ncbi:hypothetical protein CPB83DRAFT_936364 [Crepidotus variabilis]|uniref:Uncharacterized protein n=1 Tax=Crepidotus variabilis TaxID=179855 RepID=A0A9P6EDW4_9AGAR|nr:hypothetical protein CPB83DRAFT_936364 [Crepidotus variabilis]
MPPPRSLVNELLGLWLAMAFLTILTGLLIASSYKPVILCDPSSLARNSTITISPDRCTFQSKIASLVYQHGSYFQSIHIIFVQAVAACCLALLKPVLLANEWAKLERSTSYTMATLQAGIELSFSPSLATALLHARASQLVSIPTFFVFLIAGLSILSPVAISPIYRPNKSGFPTSGELVVGGGVGPDTSSSFDLQSIVPSGVVIGRALLGFASSTMLTTPLDTFDVNAAPFLPEDMVQAIWHAKIPTAVAYNTLDCGPSAPNRLVPSEEDIVSLDVQTYFTESEDVKTVTPSIAKQTFGFITNDPQISVVYLNSTVTIEPGTVSATTSVVFMAGNGTLEKAQQRITSHLPKSRIKFLDVLVCTSTTKLVISSCTINQGNITDCSPIPLSDLPSHLKSHTGHLETYVNNPPSVAIILAASPVWAYYTLAGRLPTYDTLNSKHVASNIPPLPFLTAQIDDEQEYNVPLSYIKQGIFGPTSQGLVQGMLAVWTRTNKTEFDIWATFSISHVPLLYLILGVASICSTAVTLWSTLPASSRHATKIDVARLLAISRNPNLDAAFANYADRKVDIERGVLEMKVRYVWVERLGRSVLVLGNEANPCWDDPRETQVDNGPWNAEPKVNYLEPLLFEDSSLQLILSED